MKVIPWVFDPELAALGVDWYLLEDNKKALNVEQILMLLLQGSNQWPVILQMISDGGEVSFQKPKELLANFPVWCFVLNGEITKFFDNFEAVVSNIQDLQDHPFTVGWSSEGLAVVPAKISFLDKVKTMKPGSVEIEIVEWYNIKTIQ
jgi:hypothetical protein